MRLMLLAMALILAGCAGEDEPRERFPRAIYHYSGNALIQLSDSVYYTLTSKGMNNDESEIININNLK